MAVFSQLELEVTANLLQYLSKTSWVQAKNGYSARHDQQAALKRGMELGGDGAASREQVGQRP